MAADSTVEVICPEVELLTKIETNLLCPLSGCNKLLPNTSSLRMHLVKTHNVIANAKENEIFDRSSYNKKDKNNAKKKTLYCCPVHGCVRGKNTGRPFSRLAHVKQHYMIVHGEKKFSCKNCGKKFGLNDACLRHEKACGKVFLCSCGCPFNSWTSMLTHAKRNGHAVPECETTKGVESQTISSSNTQDKSSSDPVKGLPLCISLLPIVDKKLTAFKPLRPKKLLANVETQTEQACYCAHDTSRSLVQNDKGVTVDIPYPQPELGVLCEYTQRMDEAYTQTSFMVDEEHFDMDFAMDNNFGTNDEFKEHAHSQTQTTLGLVFEGFPLFEDNETQTLESYLEFDPSNITIDCATQTKTILDDIFSVDTETQTLLPVIDFVDEQLGEIRCIPGMDSQTQTLENFYLNTGSGTSLMAPFNIIESPSPISSVETQTL